MVRHLSIKDVKEKTGLKRWAVYNNLRIFEAENPQVAEQMKKKTDGS